jgi:uncharacterized membrane protein YdcZ (DUF606 family)
MNCWFNVYNQNPEIMRTLGIVLIVLGALMMIYTGFNYITEEKVVDIGPIEINKEKEHPVNWSPIVGGVLLLAGIIVIAAGRNKKVLA